MQLLILFELIEKEIMAKKTSIKKAMTKTQMISEISEDTALTKKEVAAVLVSLEGVIERHIKKGAAGTCTVPGLLKIKTVKKPARKAQKNVPNPFKPGEMMDIQAKPASTKVKVLPLKRLKDMV